MAAFIAFAIAQIAKVFTYYYTENKVGRHPHHRLRRHAFFPHLHGAAAPPPPSPAAPPSRAAPPSPTAAPSR